MKPPTPDGWSLVARRATDFLFASNPKGTSLGTMFGIAIDGVSHGMHETIQRMAAIDVASIRCYHFVAIGVFAFNFHRVFGDRDLPPVFEDAIAAIKRAEKEHHLNHAQVKEMYSALIERVVARASLEGKAAAAKTRTGLTKSQPVSAPNVDS